MSKITLPYGSWPSPISSELLTANTVRLGETQLDNGHCYWLEQRPEEQGRCVVVCQKINDDGSLAERYDVTPKDVNVRSKAHEYGGGSYLVDQGILYFINAHDQRIYKVSTNVNNTSASTAQLSTELSTELPTKLPTEPSSTPPPIVLSPEGNYRYADLYIDHTRDQLICICERHREEEEPENSIVSLQLDGFSTIGFNVLAFGNDFYSNPSVSPDGEKLTWLTWNHPNMPWDNSECWIADFNHSGMLHKHRLVAGSDESIFQPQWSPTGDLLFVSDRNNWWNLYSYNTYNKYTECLLKTPAEFATPQWVFGMSTYGFLNSYTLFCSYTQNGNWHLGTLDLMSHKFSPLDIPFSYIESIACQDDDDTALFIAATPHSPSEIIRWHASHPINNDENHKPAEPWQSLAKSTELTLSPEALSTPQAITFENSQAQDVYGFYYPPTHAEYKSPDGTKPPLIVMCHGGPTGATQSALNIKTQYWTSRGFAVFDINYSGSTGYGRDYRRRLYPHWGVRDVDDLCCAANYAIKQGWADENKIAIRGSSAGGYSVLAALTFQNTFNAGASLYGIGDLSSLAEDTHKFESRYLDQLVGRYPSDKTIYDERSPLLHTEKLSCPVIFLQGLEDKVVPPNQAEAMVAALHEKHIPVAYASYPNEGHGFRQADTIRHAIDVEYAFYATVLELETKEELPEVPFK